jgi:hypothetical protein
MHLTTVGTAVKHRSDAIRRLSGLAVGTFLPLAMLVPVLQAADSPVATPAAATATATPPIVKAVDDTSGDIKHLEGTNFTLDYPASWNLDDRAKDYDKVDKNNFRLASPGHSYIQFTILPKIDTAGKIVNDTVKKLDGPAITTLAKTTLTDWGNYKGQGFYLKGKIVGTFPGGIKVFVFSTPHFNVQIIEYFFSDELNELKDDIDHISQHFVMK